jgi:hypothetical protein
MNLVVQSDVSLVNKIMNLFPKRFRSKASSAASLSPGRFVSFGEIGSDFPRSSYYDTVSDVRG